MEKIEPPEPQPGAIFLLGVLGSSNSHSSGIGKSASRPRRLVSLSSPLLALILALFCLAYSASKMTLTYCPGKKWLWSHWALLTRGRDDRGGRLPGVPAVVTTNCPCPCRLRQLLLREAAEGSLWKQHPSIWTQELQLEGENAASLIERLLKKLARCPFCLQLPLSKSTQKLKIKKRECSWGFPKELQPDLP